MPSNSYDFRNEDPPPEISSPKYKPTERSDIPPAPKKVKDTNLSRKENNVPPTTSTNGTADPDAKWKANYVPTIYDVKEFKNVNLYTANEASSSKKGQDDLDAKWRQNYVPTPFDMDKVNIEEGRHTNIGVPASAPNDSSKRQKWTSKSEFIFSCLGLTIGIGNVVRFPFLAYRHGGGAFLLPYLIFLVLVGMPLYFLELGIGQYSQLGPLNVWRCASVMHGVGVAMLVLSLITAVYYNQIMAYCLYYIFGTLAYVTDDLPWTKCNPSWATNDCYELLQTTQLSSNSSQQSSAYQYFHNKVLQTPVLSPLSDDIGTIRWDLALCLLLSWVLVFLVLVKGVRSTGKAAFLITTVPCACLLAIMIGGVTMEGASKGLLYLFVPQWDKLASVGVWRVALEQMLFSLSVAYGGVIMYGSFCNFRNKIHYDALAICIADFVISIIASVGVFSVLGAMAFTLGIDDIAQLPDMTHSLAFVTFPSAISSSLPVPHVWAFIFFLALFTLGLSSLVGHIHTLVGAVQDSLPSLRASTLPIAGVLCGSCFLLGLPLCAEQRGFFILSTLDRYGIGISVLVVALCELLILSWVYGVRRISDDFNFMLGHAPSMFWKVCWAFLSPAIILVVIIYSAVTWHDPDLDMSTDPTWGPGLRWGLTGISIGFIPVVFLIMLLKRACSKSQARLFTPSLSWGPGDSEARNQLISARNAGGIDNPALSYKA